MSGALSAATRACKSPRVTVHSPDASSTDQAPVEARYDALVTEGAIERDRAQVRLVRAFDKLARRLTDQDLAHKGAFGWLFGRRERNGDQVKGLYVWGAVGRGKTMLMDVFFDAIDVEPKRRVHFHEFMADVHERIFAFRQRVKRGEERDTDPLRPVAAEIAEEASLLCFDEFSVTDIADAMILGRLFAALFEEGVVVVATSNVEPDRLYEGGLNRALFLPFVALLKDRMEIVRLDARTDFRLEKLGGSPTYHVPADARAKQALDEAFRKVSGAERGQPMRLIVKGHIVEVPEAAGGVARCRFAELCERAYAAADYLAVAQRFHTVIVEAIPVMSAEKRNEAKRFIMLIDTLYDAHVKLLASAEAEPHALYTGVTGVEALEFARAASRLVEMRSADYLALPHGRADSAASGDTTGIVET